MELQLSQQVSLSLFPAKPPSNAARSWPPRGWLIEKMDSIIDDSAGFWPPQKFANLSLSVFVRACWCCTLATALLSTSSSPYWMTTLSLNQPHDFAAATVNATCKETAKHMTLLPERHGVGEKGMYIWFTYRTQSFCRTSKTVRGTFPRQKHLRPMLGGWQGRNGWWGE